MGLCCSPNLNPPSLYTQHRAHARALLVTFDDAGDAGGGAGGRADALTREIQISFRRLDADIRGLCGAAASDGLAAGAASDGGVREQVQRQLARALFTLSADFRREQTRFLNKVEQQRGYEAGSSIGLVEEEKTSAGAAAAAAFGGGGAGGAGGGGGMGSFTQAQLLRAAQAEALVEERDTEIRKVRRERGAGAGGQQHSGRAGEWQERAWGGSGLALSRGKRGRRLIAWLWLAHHPAAVLPPPRWHWIPLTKRQNPLTNDTDTAAKHKRRVGDNASKTHTQQHKGRRDDRRARPDHARPVHLGRGAGHDARPRRRQRHGDGDAGARCDWAL